MTGQVLSHGGHAVLQYRPADHGHPVADDSVVLETIDRAVAAAFEQLPGWWLSSNDDDFIDALLAAGATMVRFAHNYRLDLTDQHRAWPIDERITALDRPIEELAELSSLAYPPNHADYEPVDQEATIADLNALLTGKVLGPFDHDASGQIVINDQLAGVCIINIVPEDPPWGGPWVADLFRRPGADFAGLGELLLRRTIVRLAQRSETKLGLAVSDGNPAERLYQKLGFVAQTSTRKVRIPGQLLICKNTNPAMGTRYSQSCS